MKKLILLSSTAVFLPSAAFAQSTGSVDFEEAIVITGGSGFTGAQMVHYALARGWIFPDSERRMATGFVIFLLNAGLGMAITLGLYAALLEWTSMNYLVARVLVSVFAGLAMFVSNATLNFRKV